MEVFDTADQEGQGGNILAGVDSSPERKIVSQIVKSLRRSVGSDCRHFEFRLRANMVIHGCVGRTERDLAVMHRT